MSYLKLVTENYNYILYSTFGLFIILLISLILKNRPKKYNYFIKLIKKNLKKALDKLDQLDDIDIKEELILYGEKDLNEADYLTIKDYLIDDYLLKRLLNKITNSDSHDRAKAGRTLIKIGTPQAIDYVTCLLYDEDKEIRNLIIEELSKLQNPRIITTLINYLDNCEDLVILNSLKKAFLKIGKKSSYELLKLLNSDNSTHVSWSIKLLTEIGDDRAIEPLIELLYNHPKFEVRIIAARGLAQLDLEGNFKFLKDKLGDENSEVRAEIVTLLGQYNQDEVASLLYNLLFDNSKLVRNNTCQSLLKLGDIGIRQLILAVEKDDIQEDVLQFLNNIDALDLIKSTKNVYEVKQLDQNFDFLDLNELNLSNY
ncbi:hypothetical protein U472_09330 [Orenia metallireducens]|uniref:HEAT repeat n=1 Tax=Orenia metallireducens TaxID=1413210 RepID=A0A1C0A7L1_9FIRM|nr:HEAT repeat domain-containing protein [Orenia metallireducens]OCL26204.1 hypothetical protein U472_09330 [Orenia metallireducens]